MNKKVKRFFKLLKPVSNDLEVVLICGMASGGSTLTSSLMDQYLENDITVHESQFNPIKSPLQASNKINDFNSFEEYEHELFHKHTTFENPKQFRKESIKIYKNFSGYTPYLSRVFDKSPNYHLIRFSSYYEAFNNIKFVVIFRDPKETIEGMLRKWPVFKRAGVEKLANFWSTLFLNFLNFEDTHPMKSVYLDYSDLVEDPQKQLQRISSTLDLPFRKKIKTYTDKVDNIGKGLRNVQSGQIVISKSYKKLWQTSFTEEEINIINSITKPVLDKLKLKAKS